MTGSFFTIRGRGGKAWGCYYFQRLQYCPLNLTMVRRTYSFCRRGRSLKRWAGSSVIMLLDRSLLVTDKTQSNYIGNKWPSYYSSVIIILFDATKKYEFNLTNLITCYTTRPCEPTKWVCFPSLTDMWYFAHPVLVWNFLLPSLQQSWL